MSSSIAAPARKGRPFTAYILVALLLGVLVGYLCNTRLADHAAATEVAGYVSLIADIFLRLIKMIIAPLVFSTLVVGIAHMGDTSAIGRVGIKALGWFILFSVISLSLGFLFANLLQPGHNTGLPLPDAAASGVAASTLTAKQFVLHLVPASVVQAMATNEILQIVVFSLFFGVALASLGERARHLVQIIEQLSHAILKVTNAVMKMAPLAVFAAITSVVTTQGIGILWTFAKFIGGFYLGLVVLWAVLLVAGWAVLGGRVVNLVKLLREPFLVSFSTASSEAAYPKMLDALDALDRFGVRRRISSFVLPMGYSFNLDGSMMYCAFATLFIAQVYDIHLSIVTQLAMMGMLMLTSKGIAGVPRASLVVVAATLGSFGMPEAGLLLIMGVDQFLDMGRSATNAVGNGIAAAVVAKWEGDLLPEGKVDPDAAEDVAGMPAASPSRA
ncbi:MAG: Proton/sodium-glutamate symport protein [Paracidovorax wautersii]|uniref:Proton/sodium-glutamate symport protein n=1 Tax=Paracidovorax wautersii TaxID=1177982 RepID=A0A7V8JRY7_9BURK|nr:MAG: Proton/sodium-glutamate symport protein [Paracidovorax wautersii]